MEVFCIPFLIWRCLHTFRFLYGILLGKKKSCFWTLHELCCCLLLISTASQYQPVCNSLWSACLIGGLPTLYLILLSETINTISMGSLCLELGELHMRGVDHAMGGRECTIGQPDRWDWGRGWTPVEVMIDSYVIITTESLWMTSQV